MVAAFVEALVGAAAGVDQQEFAHLLPTYVGGEHARPDLLGIGQDDAGVPIRLTGVRVAALGAQGAWGVRTEDAAGGAAIENEAVDGVFLVLDIKNAAVDHQGELLVDEPLRLQFHPGVLGGAAVVDDGGGAGNGARRQGDDGAELVAIPLQVEIGEVEAQAAVEKLVLQAQLNLERILRFKARLAGVAGRPDAEATAAEALRIADVGRAGVRDFPSGRGQQDDVIPGIADLVGRPHALRQPGEVKFPGGRPRIKGACRVGEVGVEGVLLLINVTDAEAEFQILHRAPVDRSENRQ